MLIALVHTGKAFLPETEAYVNYFEARGVKVLILHQKEKIPDDTDIEWRFMGVDLYRQEKKRFLVHEYGSASTPPFMGIKNSIKRNFNCQPDYRIFLNDYVRRKFSFPGKVPFGYRDMGISPAIMNFRGQPEEKEFDFVYIGGLEPPRKPEILLSYFTIGCFSNKSLLIISREYRSLQIKTGFFNNIHFTGPVSHNEIPFWLSKARFAINYIPDREPYNEQTPVKFLEYAAMRMPVVSTEYSWIKDFRKKYGGNYYFLKGSDDPRSWEKICQFPFGWPDLSAWTWDRQIEGSGVMAAYQNYLETR